MKNSKKKHLFLAALICLAGISVVLWLWGSFMQDQQRDLKQEVDLTGHFAAVELEHAVRDNIRALENLKGRIENTSGSYFQHWEYDARQILRQNPSFKFIEWIDSNMIIRKVQPLEGNEAAVDLDISQFDFRRDEWLGHTRDSSFNITAWVQMVQGGSAFLVDQPVYYDGAFQGTITAGMDFTNHFDRLLKGLEDYSVKMEDDKGSVFYTHNQPQPDSIPGRYIFQSQLILDSADAQVWKFTFMPEPELMPSQSTEAYLGLIAGGMISLLLGVVTYYFQRSRYETTLIKQVNQDLLKTTMAYDEESKRAAQASRSKSDFLSTMSHEIRTPLNAILGFIDILRNMELAEQQRKYLEMMNLSSKNLLSLVNDILEIDKIESGKIALRKEVFKPAEELQNLVNLYRPGFEEKQLYLEDNLPHEKFSKGIGDRTKFNQIFTNLIRNAFKFTHRGGVEIEYSEEKSGNTLLVKVVVRDTGIGIPPDKLNGIFERFSQVDSSLKRKHEGTGLGLAITSQLLEMMGGSVQVKSTPGEGSAFEVQMALPLVHEDFTPDNSTGHQKSFEGARVLIAEDNAMNITILQQILKQLKVKSDVAENGVEAVEMGLENSYDLVFMDVHMPEMDGFEATRQLREHKSGLAIIGLSANVTREALQEAQEAGMQDYMTKPFSRKRLIEILNNYLDQSSMEAKFSKRG